jgi:hypothetical protein
MKNAILILATVITTAGFYSCTKKSSSSTPTPATNGFVWSENGGANQTADSANYTFGTSPSTQSYIMAYKNFSTGPTSRNVEINLSGNTATTFTIPAQGDFVYWRDTTYSMATGGSIVVTSNSGGKASGTFDVTFSGTPAHVTGTFTNIPTR